MIKVVNVEHNVASNVYTAHFSDDSSEDVECFNCSSKVIFCLFMHLNDDSDVPPLPPGINIKRLSWNGSHEYVNGTCHDADCIAFSTATVRIIAPDRDSQQQDVWYILIFCGFYFNKTKLRKMNPYVPSLSSYHLYGPYSPNHRGPAPWPYNHPLRYVVPLSPLHQVQPQPVVVCSLKDAPTGCHTTSQLGDAGTCCVGTCVTDAHFQSTTLPDGRTIYRGKCT